MHRPASSTHAAYGTRLSHPPEMPLRNSKFSNQRAGPRGVNIWFPGYSCKRWVPLPVTRLEPSDEADGAGVEPRGAGGETRQRSEGAAGRCLGLEQLEAASSEAWGRRGSVAGKAVSGVRPTPGQQPQLAGLWSLRGQEATGFRWDLTSRNGQTTQRGAGASLIHTNAPSPTGQALSRETGKQQ